jgi:hypothetical protein
VDGVVGEPDYCDLIVAHFTYTAAVGLPMTHHVEGELMRAPS